MNPLRIRIHVISAVERVTHSRMHSTRDGVVAFRERIAAARSGKSRCRGCGPLIATRSIT